MIALQSYIPNVHIEREPRLMRKRPDIYAPSLHTYIEIKTWVWGPQPKNQFTGDVFKQLLGGKGLFLHKFTNTASMDPVVLQHEIACGAAVPESCQDNLLMLSRLTVLPVFREWVAFLTSNKDRYDAAGG
mmetsp:Transcript_5495/g.20765  ORF Transcript_5495/g.20765 Transcript_5495/m.20765 type:complete len:130 (+) Transcript_5495:418-807(+)